MDERLKYALILAFVLNSALALSGFYENTFDAYTHMFFADHYRRSWFDTWETKWYGGFSVTSYPPLAHQVIALVSFAVGLEWAYQILTLCLMIIFPIAVYKFSRIFVSNKAAGLASIISVFLPSVALTTYNFGQFPTLFSLASTLFTICHLHNYLKNGAKHDLGLATLLLGVSVGTHHFTAMFFLPLMTILLVISVFQKGIDFGRLLRRTAKFAVFGIGVSLLVLYPFLLFSPNMGMKPIPHITRINLFSDLFAFVWFFLSMYGPTLVLIPSVAWLTYRDKKLLPIFTAAVLLFILGLGGTTFLPSLILGDLWLVLTYERFALWASIVFLPLFGLLFASRSKFIRLEKNKKRIQIFFLATLALSAIYVASNPVLQHTNVNLPPIQEFLSENENSKWRYITLGFGDARMQELSILTNASTLDGYYFIGRTIPILMNSSISTLDSAKFFGEQGLSVLKNVLANANDYNLRWVFCNDPQYYTLLYEGGFIMQFSQDTTGDGRLHGVTIWEKEGISPIEYDLEVINKPNGSLANYSWGITPLSFLVGSLVVYTYPIFLRVKRSNNTESQRSSNVG